MKAIDKYYAVAAAFIFAAWFMKDVFPNVSITLSLIGAVLCYLAWKLFLANKD